MTFLTGLAQFILFELEKVSGPPRQHFRKIRLADPKEFGVRLRATSGPLLKLSCTSWKPFSSNVTNLTRMFGNGGHQSPYGQLALRLCDLLGEGPGS